MKYIQHIIALLSLIMVSRFIDAGIIRVAILEKPGVSTDTQLNMPTRAVLFFDAHGTFQALQDTQSKLILDTFKQNTPDYKQSLMQLELPASYYMPLFEKYHNTRYAITSNFVKHFDDNAAFAQRAADFADAQKHMVAQGPTDNIIEYKLYKDLKDSKKIDGVDDRQIIMVLLDLMGIATIASQLKNSAWSRETQKTLHDLPITIERIFKALHDITDKILKKAIKVSINIKDVKAFNALKKDLNDLVAKLKKQNSQLERLQEKYKAHAEKPFFKAITGSLSVLADDLVKTLVWATDMPYLDLLIDTFIFDAIDSLSDNSLVYAILGAAHCETSKSYLEKHKYKLVYDSGYRVANIPQPFKDQPIDQLAPALKMLSPQLDEHEVINKNFKPVGVGIIRRAALTTQEIRKLKEEL